MGGGGDSVPRFCLKTTNDKVTDKVRDFFYEKVKNPKTNLLQ